jgi:hypothetical protein
MIHDNALDAGCGKAGSFSYEPLKAAFTDTSKKPINY